MGKERGRSGGVEVEVVLLAKSLIEEMKEQGE